MEAFITKIHLLKQIHLAISKANTGAPPIFARRLGISERYLYRVIEDLKEVLEAPIEYDKNSFTYIYSKHYDLFLALKF